MVKHLLSFNAETTVRNFTPARVSLWPVSLSRELLLFLIFAQTANFSGVTHRLGWDHQKQTFEVVEAELLTGRLPLLTPKQRHQ